MKGYRLVAKNFKTPVGEIDLLVRRGRLLAVVEVKARPRRAEALTAISGRQQKRIARATEFFLQQNPEFAGLTLRFDALFLCPNRLPLHMMDAWRLL